MRGPEKSKYLAEVLESVANSEEKLKKVEFELRNRVCGYYKHNEEVSIDVESIHGKLEKVSNICEPRFENRDQPENVQAFDLISCNVNKVGGISHETRNKEVLMSLEAMESICSDSKDKETLKVDESKFANNNFFSNFETSDSMSNPCNGKIGELLKIEEQNLESTNGYVTLKSVAHNHLHNGDDEKALQIYSIPQIDRQDVLNYNGNLESLDLIPRRDKINLQNLTLETGTTEAIDLIPRHDSDGNDLQIKEDSRINQVINLEPIVEPTSQIHVGDEEISESLEQKSETDHKKKIPNNNIKVLVDKIHSAVECRLKQCLEPYRSRKQRGPFTLKKIDTEKHLMDGIDKNSFGDGLKKSNSENGGGMEFVEKLFASYYQRERDRKEDTEIERENDKSQKLSRILDKIASKGLEKLLQGSHHINNLTDEIKMKKNEKIEDKFESTEGNMTATNTNDKKITTDGTKKENLILNKDGNGGGLKREQHRNRKTKSKKYENYLPTIGEKGESSYENERGNKKNRREDVRSNKKDRAKKFVEKIKSPYKPAQDDKKMNRCLKTGGNKMKIIEKGVKEIRKIKKSPYSKSFDIGKRKMQGEPIRKRVIKKGCKKKRVNKMTNEENDEEDSKIVCISLKNQGKEEGNNEKQNTNEMFDIIKELVFRKNNVQEKVKSKKKKQKKRKEKEEGKEKEEKNVRKKKIDKPVWLVPDGHPDGFQPPKTKHRMSAHKLENFSEEDKQNKNSLSNDKFKRRKEFVIFLDDKQNNIFGTKSAFRMPMKNC
ncbi:uncharacterized protein LOC111048873 [Nilaparvata lugens]|uniref:uncharacterized protein LOC111048873 n=1 Tax=Nilaparvata lugens TaxID=108931 RepID=UPI00193E1B73|nr:uncharacterized protein LOC111048873 [Nilaparvata lugens]